MKFNYQIMTKQDAEGRYIPDYDSLIANSSCEAEAKEWQDAQKRDFRFAWNMVVAMRMKCGDWEIFQTPVNQWHPLEDELEMLYSHALESECTRCNIKRFSHLVV